MKIKKILFPFILFIASCDFSGLISSSDSEVEYNNLDIYDVWKQNNQLEQDSSGYYHFPYSPTGTSQSDYGTVKYFTEVPVTRVFWASPDSFFVYHMYMLTDICVFVKAYYKKRFL